MDSLKFYNDLQNFFWYVNSVNRHTRVQEHYYDDDSGDRSFAHNSSTSTELMSGVKSRERVHQKPINHQRGDSSISQMPGCGPNALPEIGYSF